MKRSSRHARMNEANMSMEEGGNAADHIIDASSSSSPPPSPSYRIAIVSDFVYPRLGGVELHQYQLAQTLRRRGHQVCIITGTYEDSQLGDKRQGIRYLTNGLKVYYCPVMSLHQQASLPNLFCFFPLLRSILLREQIQIIHGHQSTSALAHEALLHGRTMGLVTIFTDHSLFSFGNTAAINLNKVMKFSLTSASATICVSHCSKENLCLRAYLDPNKVFVIPNAVDTTKLTPAPENAPPIHERQLLSCFPQRQQHCDRHNTQSTSCACLFARLGFTIVVLSRLVYRKGMDLIIEVIPAICALFPHVHFLVGGDGPKRVAMEEMREKYQLQERVEMIGAVAHTDVRNVLTRGHLFLNCSLTEAFCIAILEAVSCGLYVVSTRVGGVPEILPPHVMEFAAPNPKDLITAITRAIPRVMQIHAENPNYAYETHQMVREMYNWHDVAKRTERVYQRAMEEFQIEQHKLLAEGSTDTDALSPINTFQPVTPDTLTHLTSTSAPLSPPPDHGSFLSLSLRRLSSYTSCGIFVGLLFALVVILDHFLWRFLEWRQPRSQIDLAVQYPKDTPTSDQHQEEAEIEDESGT